MSNRRPVLEAEVFQRRPCAWAGAGGPVVGLLGVIGLAFPFQLWQCVEPFVLVFGHQLVALPLIAWAQTSVFRLHQESQCLPFSVLLPMGTVLSFVRLSQFHFSRLTSPFAKRAVSSLAYNAPRPPAPWPHAWALR